MSTKFLVFAASHRPESYNRKLAKTAAHYASACGAEIDFAEFSEFDMPLYNDTQVRSKSIPTSAQSFLERLKKADGLMIASPEYNWSFPANLKNIIDWTSILDISSLNNKTALLLCASPSTRGGILGLEHLRSPLSAIKLQVNNKVFPLGDCNNMFDANSTLTNEKKCAELNSIVKDYVTFTKKLANN